LNPTGQGQPNERGPYPEPSTRMYLLKHAHQTNRSFIGDVVLLVQLRTLVDLILHFGKVASRQVVKETVLEYGSEFWLNKYFEKELFYALKHV
jgi:hypothetical protein